MTESFFKDDNENQEQETNAIPELDSPVIELDDPEIVDEFQSEEGRMAAIMSYIPFLCFVPLLNMKDNKEAQFHAKQGVMLFLIEN